MEVKSLSYANQEQEQISPGPRTELEYLLVAELIKFCNQNEIEADICIIQQLYMTCLDLMQVMDPSLPISTKSIEEIIKIVNEYNRHRQVFQATCIAQVKINFDEL